MRYKNRKKFQSTWTNVETSIVFSRLLPLETATQVEREMVNLSKALGRISSVKGRPIKEFSANIQLIKNRVWGVVTQDPHDSKFVPNGSYDRTGFPLSWFERDCIRVAMKCVAPRPEPPTAAYFCHIFGRNNSDCDIVETVMQKFSKPIIKNFGVWM